MSILNPAWYVFCNRCSWSGNRHSLDSAEWLLEQHRRRQHNIWRVKGSARVIRGRSDR